MLCDTSLEYPRWAAIDMDDLAERAAVATLMHLGLRPDRYEISLLACNDARIAALNSDFRGKPVATNVLSWPSEEPGAKQDGAMPEQPVGAAGDAPQELGDIAIAWETCATEAVAAGKAMRDHVTHLVVHGTLHLLGFDHIRDLDATLMESIEVAILGKLGIADPYSDNT